MDAYSPPLTRKAALLLCAASRYNFVGILLEFVFAVIWPAEHRKIHSIRAYGYHERPFPLRNILWPRTS